jgi:hypothetical protein
VTRAEAQQRHAGAVVAGGCVEIVAVRRRDWSVSAIARHTGRDRKTIRAWLEQGEQRAPRELP